MQSANSTVLDLRQDQEQHWVAVLACGHTQHLRHQPPWQNRHWLLDPQQRNAIIGQPFVCGWCTATAAEADSQPCATPPNQTDKEG